MNDFLKYQRTIFLLVVLLACAGTLALYTQAGSSNYAAGLVLGTLVGLVKFRMRGIALMRLASAQNQEGVRTQVKASMLGHAMMIATLLAAFLLPDTFHVWTTFAGLFLPNLVLIGDGILRPTVFAGAGTTESASPLGEGSVDDA